METGNTYYGMICVVSNPFGVGRSHRTVPCVYCVIGWN